LAQAFGSNRTLLFFLTAETEGTIMEPKSIPFHCVVICFFVQLTCGIRIKLSTKVDHDENVNACDHMSKQGGKSKWESKWQNLDETPPSDWYLYRLYPGARHIVEIGGNRGDDIDEFLKKHEEAVIFTFEPTPHFFGLLKSKYQDNPHVNVSNEGASDTSGEAEFIMDGFGSSGLQNTINGEHVKVQLSDVDDILTRVSQRIGSPPDVLSINCEGCEYAVMQRLIDKGWLGKIPFIQLSWHTPNQVNDRVAKRCNIEKALRQSHDRIYSAKYGWTGWKVV